MEDADPLILRKNHEVIIFDGVCDEPAYDHLNPLPVRMYRPNHGSDPTEKSEIFVTFDEKYFYLSARMYYTNGGEISATTKKRDGAEGGNDNFGILLDTFNDNENALCFETNPSGLRSDFTIDNDAQVILGARPFNRSWNTFWDVKMNVIGDVWHVEMQIPLSSLRFQDVDGSVYMGMTIWRQVASKQEWMVYPLVSNKLGPFSVWKPSQAKKIVLEGLHRTNPVYLTPYVLAGLEMNSEMNEEGTAYVTNYDRKLNAGLDVKYSLTSNLTLDLTINTDFAQVEADDQVVNLTRFSIFFPEKRQFFVERSSIFTIRTGYLDQLFYSRRIGLYEGEIVPIIGGVRLVGRAGKWDIGFLDMQTSYHEFADTEEDSLIRLESTNFGVLRLRKQVINSTSYVGGMMTSKIDVKGNYNINAALDLIYNPFRNDYITVNYAQTFDKEIPQTKQILEQGKFFFNWINRSNIGLNYDFILSRAGKFYDPEMGFELLDDYTQLYGLLGYGWVYNQEEKKMLNQQLMAWARVNKRNEDFSTDNDRYSLAYGFSLKNGFRADFEILHNHENLTEPFDLTDEVVFSEGSYNYSTFTAGFGTPTNKLFIFRLSGTAGTYYDGSIFSLGPAAVTFRPSSSFNLGLDYQYDQIDIPERDQHFRSHLARLRTELTFTTKLSLMMFFQYNTNDKFGINNVRFRYNPREGNDLYIVYNGSYNTHLYREIPELPAMDLSTFTVKYTYTFIWE
jgi:hypothetical protein